MQKLYGSSESRQSLFHVCRLLLSLLLLRFAFAHSKIRSYSIVCHKIGAFPLTDFRMFELERGREFEAKRENIEFF